MINKIERLLALWLIERARRRDLHAKLENLTDPEFLDRAVTLMARENQGV